MVTSYVAPWLSKPLSQCSGPDVASEVAVCGMAPVQEKCTTSPTVTTRCFGENSKSLTSTVWVVGLAPPPALRLRPVSAQGAEQFGVVTVAVAVHDDEAPSITWIVWAWPLPGTFTETVVAPEP